MIKDYQKIIDNSKVQDWKSLRITYEEPHVDRLYMDVDSERLMLHKIYQTDKPFYHPHPWPSVMIIREGNYMLNIGTKDQVMSSIGVGPSDIYTMYSPNVWHSIQPLHNRPVYSIMLTGKPFDDTCDYHKYGFKKDMPVETLSTVEIFNLLGRFRQ